MPFCSIYKDYKDVKVKNEKIDRSRRNQFQLAKKTLFYLKKNLGFQRKP